MRRPFLIPAMCVFFSFTVFTPFPSQAETQIITFTESISKTTKEPNHHERFSGSFGLGDLADVIGIGRVGIGIGLDTFWATGGGMQSTNVNMQADWTFTTEDLNQYNRIIGQKALHPHVPLGGIKVTTSEFAYRRQLGFSTKIGIDVNINGKWYNNIVGQTIADLGIDINDTANEKIGPHTGQGNDPLVISGDSFMHSDSLNVTDLATLVNGFATSIVGICEKIGISALKGYGAAVTKTAFEAILEKVASFSLGVNATQRTYERKFECDLSVSAKDMEGKPLAVTLDKASRHIVVDDESREYIIYTDLPPDCPPVKEITLMVNGGKYHYKDQGNVEVGIRSSLITLGTGAMTQDLFDPADHDLASSTEVLFKLKGDNLIFVPCHGIVQAGDPPVWIDGVDVKVEVFSAVPPVTSQYTTSGGGKFFNDQWVTMPEGNPPPAKKITISKQGFAGPFNTSDNLELFAKQDDGSYVITLPISEAESVGISGVVKDLSGNTIPGVEINVQGITTAIGVTDAQGRYTFGTLPRSSSYVVSAFKSGFNFEPVTRAVAGQGHQDITVDITASTLAMAGSMKIFFKLPAGAAAEASLPGSVEITDTGGRSFTQTLAGDKSVSVSLLGKYTETLAFSHPDYSFSPTTVTATFTPETAGATAVKLFEGANAVIATPLLSQSCSLALDKESIEVFGATYLQGGIALRDQEKATATATVKDGSGQPMAGIMVRFTATTADGGAGAKFVSGTTAAVYGTVTTDAAGKASAGIVALANAGSVDITARTLEKINNGAADHSTSSQAVRLFIEAPNRRLVDMNKPTGTIAAVPVKKVIDLATRKIEPGGEMAFDLTAVLGNDVATDYHPTGTILDYAIGIQKNGGAWVDTLGGTYPPARVTQVFADAGSYKARYRIRERCGQTDLWSDPVEVSFVVVEMKPPDLTFTLPSSAGSVNIPVDLSYSATAYAPFKRFMLSFGDGAGQDIDLDAVFLAGKSSWSGNAAHTYTAAGTYTLTLMASDQNDKISTMTKTVTIAALNDHTAPTGAITIVNNTGITSSREVGLRVTGSDNSGGSGVYRYRISNDGSIWSDWSGVSFPDDRPLQTISVTRPWQLTDTAGQKVVYGQLKDAADNVSASFTATTFYANTVPLSSASGDGSSPGIYPGNDDPAYTWDTQAPTGSIAIPSANSQAATVALTINDAGTASHKRMCFSANGNSWTAWEEFSASKDVILVSGQTKVYAKFADGVGNISPAYSADIPAGSGNQPPPQQPPVMPGMPGAMPGAVPGMPQAGMPGAIPGQPGAIPGQPGAIPPVPPVQNALDMPSLQQNQADNSAPSEAAPAEQPNHAKRNIAAVTEKKEEPVDLSVKEISARRQLTVGTEGEIEVILRNDSGEDIRDCRLFFESEDGTRQEERVFLRSRGDERVRIRWTPKRGGRQAVKARVECAKDKNTSNNEMSQTVDVAELERGREEVMLRKGESRDELRLREEDRRKGPAVITDEMRRMEKERPGER